ncbi:MAG: GNAT family N-acetyltransferase [Trueperaceae bacterium]
MCPSFGRVRLRPLDELDTGDWRRVHTHFKDPEISHLNGTPPNRMPLWLLKRVLRADTRRTDRLTFGVFDECREYIGTIELYDIRGPRATLGIIIGEKSHWGKGYGPEAMAALLDHAFNMLGLDLVRLSTFEDNPRAQSAFRKVGFAEVRRLPAPGGRVDVQMELRKGAWLANRDDLSTRVGRDAPQLSRKQLSREEA